MTILWIFCLFREWMMTSECLYSLLNGDDMFPTFQEMSDKSVMIWVFSKLYLYAFISFFIYIVLSTFISIVGDTYERLKDWGRMPPTRIEQFIEGKIQNPRERLRSGTCMRCLREGTSAGYFDDLNSPEIRHLRRSTLSDSQISVVSASLEWYIMCLLIYRFHRFVNFCVHWLC